MARLPPGLERSRFASALLLIDETASLESGDTTAAMPDIWAANRTGLPSRFGADDEKLALSPP